MEKTIKEIKETNTREQTSSPSFGLTRLEENIVLAMPGVLFFFFVLHAIFSYAFEKESTKEIGKIEFIKSNKEEK